MTGLDKNKRIINEHHKDRTGFISNGVNKTEIVNIKVDSVTKKQAQKVAEELGFGLSTLLNAYMKQLIKDKAVHFTAEKQTVAVQARILTLEEIKKKVLPVLRERKIKRASIFGSYARGDARSTSDVDILAEFPPHFSLFDMSGLKIELEEALGKKVDLIEYDRIKPVLKENILSDQIPIL